MLLKVTLLCSLCLSAMAWEGPQASRLVGSNLTVEVNSSRSLYDIARESGYALEHLAEANSLPVNLGPVSRSKLLIPGLRIVPRDAPEQGIVVNLPERGFYVFRKDEQARFFPIAIGQPGRFQTPVGSYSVREKVVNPEWVAPEWAGMGEDNVVPAGPNNPLGDRWIGVSAGGLGMHSTNNPASIGSASSHGCMRMYPEIARTVFDLVEVGWPVQIQYRTARVSLEEDGIYVSSFADPYTQGGRAEQLLKDFEDLDITGFAALLDLEALLARADGVCRKVVDLGVAVSVSGEKFQGARIGQRVFLTGEAVEALGLKQNFNLVNKTVVVEGQDREVTMPLARASSGAGAVFLSRGSAWFPAKELLSNLSLSYEWLNEEKLLRVTP